MWFLQEIHSIRMREFCSFACCLSARHPECECNEREGSRWLAMGGARVKRSSCGDRPIVDRDSQIGSSNFASHLAVTIVLKALLRVPLALPVSSHQRWIKPACDIAPTAKRACPH